MPEQPCNQQMKAKWPKILVSTELFQFFFSPPLGTPWHQTIESRSFVCFRYWNWTNDQHNIKKWQKLSILIQIYTRTFLTLSPSFNSWPQPNWASSMARSLSHTMCAIVSPGVNIMVAKLAVVFPTLAKGASGRRSINNNLISWPRVDIDWYDDKCKSISRSFHSHFLSAVYFWGNGNNLYLFSLQRRPLFLWLCGRSCGWWGNRFVWTLRHNLDQMAVRNFSISIINATDSLVSSYYSYTMWQTSLDTQCDGALSTAVQYKWIWNILLSSILISCQTVHMFLECLRHLHPELLTNQFWSQRTRC